MEVSMLGQLNITLMSCILGVFFGAIYDIIRIWRTFLGISYINKFTGKIKEIKLPLIKNPVLKEKEKQSTLAESIVLLITDIIYFLIVTLIMVIFVYYINNGIVRWYIFAGAMFGMMVYYFTIGKIIISISEYITFFIKVLFSYIFYFLSRPFVPIINKLKKGALHFRNKLKFKLADKKRNKYKKEESENTRLEIMRIGIKNHR